MNLLYIDSLKTVVNLDQLVKTKWIEDGALLLIFTKGEELIEDKESAKEVFDRLRNLSFVYVV